MISAVRRGLMASCFVVMSACAHHSPLADKEVNLVFELTKDMTEAPFGDAVSSKITNYSRVAPAVAIAGKLESGGLSEAQTLGFRLIIDLRGSDEEGVSQEQADAAKLGMQYTRIPLMKDAGAWDQVAQVGRLLDSPENYPVLLHCGSANRAAAVWALYRSKQGVEALTAIEEARAAGLTSREAQVRTLLKLPQLEPDTD